MTILPNTIYRFNVIHIKLPMVFFHRTRTKNFTIHMETQKTLNTQSSFEKEEWSWRNQPSWLQVILQSYSHQDSMGLAQQQKYRPMEQDTAAAAKSRQSCPTLSDPMDCSLAGSSVQGVSRQEYWRGSPVPSPLYKYKSRLFWKEILVKRNVNRSQKWDLKYWCILR